MIPNGKRLKVTRGGGGGGKGEWGGRKHFTSVEVPLQCSSKLFNAIVEYCDTMYVILI